MKNSRKLTLLLLAVLVHHVPGLAGGFSAASASQSSPGPNLKSLLLFPKQSQSSSSSSHFHHHVKNDGGGVSFTGVGDQLDTGSSAGSNSHRGGGGPRKISNFVAQPQVQTPQQHFFPTPQKSHQQLTNNHNNDDVNESFLQLMMMAGDDPNANSHHNNNHYERQQDSPIVSSSSEFHFTQSHYNATVPENSFAGTVILPVKDKMGIWNPPELDRQIHYSILSGDPLNLFRVESRQVGDFSFLVIRVRSNDRSLNREYRELYKVQIKAVVYASEKVVVAAAATDSNSSNVTLVNNNNNNNRNSSPKIVAKIGLSSSSSGKSGNNNFLRAFAGTGGGLSSNKQHNKKTFPQSLDVTSFNGGDDETPDADDNNEVEDEIIDKQTQVEEVLPPPNQRFIISDDLNFVSGSGGSSSDIANSKNNKNSNNERTSGGGRRRNKNSRNGSSKISASEVVDGELVVEEESTTTRKLFGDEDERDTTASDVQNDESFVSQLHNLPSNGGSGSDSSNVVVINNKNRRSGSGGGGGRRNRRGDGVDGNKTVSRTSRADDSANANTNNNGRQSGGRNRSRQRNRTGSGERRGGGRGRNRGGGVGVGSGGENKQVTQVLESRNSVNSGAAGGNNLQDNLVDVDGILETAGSNLRGRRIKAPATTTTTTTTTTPATRTKLNSGSGGGRYNSNSPDLNKKVAIFQAETLVYVRIIDVDDNQPVFESLSYDIGVNADTPVLAKVAKITAADADVGRNQEIYYSLPEWNDHWAIDPITGVLSPTRPLIGYRLHTSTGTDDSNSSSSNSSPASRETLRVRAKNRWNSSPNAGSFANVNVHIRPVNRYAPQIRINRPPQVEIRPYGIIYAIVSIRDPDEGENGLVDLEIKEGDPNGLFRVSPTSSRNEFYIEMSPVVAENFHWMNPEKLYNYNLTLKATDRGSPVKTSEKDFQVRLADVLWSSTSSLSSYYSSGSSASFFSPSSPFSSYAHHHPNSGFSGGGAIFEKDVYEVEISETAPPHSVVFRLKRPDSKVLLTISSGNEGQDFFLEETSGVLYTAKWLDAETKSTYTLTIDSRDRRPNRIGDLSRRRQSVAKIIVKITDGNDNDPEFETASNPTQVTLMENEPVGTKVARISARDRDQGENGYVTYNIANLKPVPFSIDHFSGEIRTAKSFDFEVDRREFQLVIRASDWGQPSRRQSQTTLDIRLQDANDNRPLFTVTECFAVIDRSMKFETEIGKLEAIDFDRNDVVSYRMVSGNEDSCFQMDPHTGKLRVMCDLRDVRSTKRNLNVTATDGEYFSDVMTIKVELWDSLKNNLTRQQHDGQVKSGIRLYSTAQSIFECRDTGVQERFDRMAALSEKNNQRLMGGGQESDAGEFGLGVDGFPLVPSRYGENVHTPSFVDLPAEITVNESTSVGTVVLKLRGRDLDKGYNGLLTFVISSGDEAHGAWDIFNDESLTATGSFSQEANLILAVPLDREDISKYVLNITVWDQGKPAKHSSKLLTIKVLDNNDCKPVFTKTAMKIKIGEGSELVGEQLLQVSAYDDDEPGTVNSELSYRLLNELPEFTIEEKTGIIRLMRDLDRERQDLYELLVVAEDGGSPRLSSIALVTIIVEDKNDCPPRFESFTQPVLPTKASSPRKMQQPGTPSATSKSSRSGGGGGGISPFSSNTRLVKIMEDWPVGGVVTQVLAKDDDLGIGGVVRYSLMEGDEHSDFAIDEVSGVVRVKKELDYEKTSIYNLTIRARDLGMPPLFTDSFLVVEVYDVVEQELSVSFPDFVIQANISESAPIGTIVTNVTLVPSDAPLFYLSGGLILFIEGESRSYFTIDNQGIIRTAHNLDHETHSSHWLSVVARSISSGRILARLECYVKVLDVNECHPLTTQPSYTIHVSENVPPSTVLAKLDAIDCDPGPGGMIHFTLKTSTPYFEVHPESGEIFTTEFPLDREKQGVHIFDVVVTDTGIPPLNSTTQVMVKLLDENDQRPKFLYTRGIRYIPELIGDLQRDEPLEENSLEESVEDEEEDEEEELSKWSDWMAIENPVVVAGGGDMAEGGSWKKIYRVVALDGDAGPNGTIRYRLKFRANPEIAANEESFSIHPTTGEIFTTASLLKPDTTLKFLIEASDGGTPEPLVQETELVLRAKSLNRGPSEPPKILLVRNHVVSLTTKERAGYTVETIDAEDPDGDDLWYEIVSGDPELYFNMWPESEKLILARPIPFAKEFRLNISVTDGFNVVFTQLLVKVIESERASSLIWEKSNYTGIISEQESDFSPVTTLRVVLPPREDDVDDSDGDSDQRENNWRKRSSDSTVAASTSVGTILYGFHNAEDSRSLEIFSIDTLSGLVSIAKPSLIDRESLPRHVLTVKARDPIHFYMFTRLVIVVEDTNDHAPDWRYSVTELRIPETTAVGSLISQIEAFDMDSGENGRLSYSITFGNIGATFGIDKDTGWLQLDRPLSIPFGDTSLEYQLTIQASDHGKPPLSATTNLNILVTLASDEEVVALKCSGDGTLSSRNSPFSSSKMMRVRVKENSRPGTYVTTVRAVNSKAVSFEIEENRTHMFWIDPTTGVILVGKGRGILDRETKASYEIFVKATNSRGATALCRVVIDIIDVNDHKPQFTKLYYEGIIREDAPLGTLVRKRPESSSSTSSNDFDEKRPLVLESMDGDVGLNAVITYSIVEDDDMRKVFHIDPSTGALLLVTSLDYEKRSQYLFHVKATDGGGLISPTVATVNVTVENVNMKKPVVQSARVEMLLPTAPGVLIHQVQAVDADGDSLDFNITRGNSQEFFKIGKRTGEIRIGKADGFSGAKHVLEVAVTDGRFWSLATITVHVRQIVKNSDFTFRNSTFYGSVIENSTKSVNILSLTVVGAHMNERLRFQILNPNLHFGIKRTSGVIFTTGKKMDREEEPVHNLLVEVHGDDPSRVARAFVSIHVADVNDNAPQFMNLPYVAVVSMEAKSGDPVIQIKAFDADEGENAMIRYELVRSPHGDIYDLDRHSGVIRLRRRPDGVGHHEITIKAYDGGVPTCTTETTVLVKVVSSEQPVFEQQWYETWIPEDAAVGSTALALVAHAKNPILYSIEGGNELDEFGIDYQTGVLYVNSPLDFESQTTYRLTVRATDLVTSSGSNTHVLIRLKDSNDCRPRFTQATYHIRLAEGYMPSQGGLLASLRASDNDTGINAMLTYELIPDDAPIRISAEGERISSRRISRHISTEDLDLDMDMAGGNNRNHHHHIHKQQQPPPQHHHLLQRNQRNNNDNDDRGKGLFIELGDEQEGTGGDDGGGDEDAEEVNLVDTDNIDGDEEVLEDDGDGVYEDVTERMTGKRKKKMGRRKLAANRLLGSGGAAERLENDDGDSGLYDSFGGSGAGGTVSFVGEIKDRMVNEDATSNQRAADVSRYFMVRPNDGSIVLKQMVDYERAHEFRFSVVVKDSGIPALSSTARVVVEVLDVNDESVVFERPIYHARVSEAAPRGHFISKVSAYDPDIMDSLRFAIIGQSHHYGTAFEIDEKSGVVTLSQPSVLLNELNFELNISVTDGVFTSYSRVHIEVEPRNHHAPLFSSLIYEVGCPENSPDGTLIATLTATDPDRSIFGKIRYSIADTDEPDLFVIDEDTGEVRLTSSPDVSLDREMKSSHTVEVVAEDGGGWLGYTKLVVKVIDVNEYAPQFPVSEYRVTVPADRIRSKTPILQVVAVDADTEFGIRYSIVDLPSANSSIKRDSSFFEINPDSGEVRLRMSDEDVLKFTKDKERVDLQFWAGATDEGGLHSYVPVTVVLLPEGEPSPEIHPQNATFFVKEDAPIGSVITTLRVTNIEEPKFRVVSSNDEFFQVDHQGNLLIKARLDQEEEDKHTVVIWAESGDGMSVATSQVMVRVFQFSGRKHPPVFQSPEYRIKVAEDFPEGSLLFTVRAIDSDKSNNIKEKYSLATTGNNANDASTMHHFSVNQDHGWITLVNKLDYERQTEHVLHVVAADSDKPFLVSTATVIIQVLNVPDCPVAFDTNHYFSSVREDVPEGTIVATVFATDQDVSKSAGITVTSTRSGGGGSSGSGSSSAVTDTVIPDSITSNYLAYFIVDGNEKGHFKMNDRGEISVWRRLDYEQEQKFLLRIVATDGLHTDYANVTITVMDVNDNSPICPSPEYEIELSEGAPVGTYVISVEASDPDLSAMSPSFSLSGPGSPDFHVNSETGVITTKEKLDREDKAEFYNLVAFAEDRESGEACRVDIRIRILDENDHAPKFTERGQYVVTVKEDAPVGALIGKVHADDEDVGLNRKVRYALLSVVGGGSSSAAAAALSSQDQAAAMIDDQFGMDGTSGVISLLRPLDRELVSQYNLTIQATDDGIPPLSSVASMRIVLMDVNDNPPVFAFNYYSASISELAPVSTEVTRVLATSKDIGVNADITYDIVGGNGYNHFGIHPKTGVIFVSAPLDYERVKEYVLAIRARDGGTPPLASQALVNITLIDMNDNAPVFNVDSYSVEIAEDAPIGASVMQILAADLDSGSNSQITYQLGAGDRLKHFQIDPSKGIITVASALDREMIPKYSLEVWAVDHGMPSLSSTTTVNIEIQDRNDNPPLLLVPQDEIIVQEDRPIGHIIHKFDVSDADAPPNSQPFSWDLRDADRGKGASVPFTISEQGNLKVAGKLNFQRKNLYRLQVRVFDNGDPPLYSDANVTVKVVDKSQWPPVVSTLTVTAITADETYPSGIPLGKVHASDFDPYDVLVYSLLETPNSASFTIDPSNGTLKSLTPLRAGSYELGIGVSDGRWTARGDAYVKIVTLTSLMPDMKLDQTHFPEEATSTSSSTGSAGTTRKVDEKSINLHYHNVKSRKDISSFAVVLTLKGHNPQSLLTRIFALINAIKEAMGLEPQGGSLYDVVILSVQSSKGDKVFPMVHHQNKQQPHSLPVIQNHEPSHAEDTPPDQNDEESQTPPETQEKLEATTTRAAERTKREASASATGPAAVVETEDGTYIVPAVDILMAVRKSTDGSFVPPTELVKKLRFAQPQIESVLSAKMIRLTYDICREDSCERGQCRTVVNFEGTQSLITTETLSLITPNHYLETLCFCPPGYGGAKCEKVINACAHSECMSGYICVPDASPKGYACLCRKIYCPPGIACEEDDHCAQQTVSFSGTSFLAYNVGPSLERELTLSLRVKTLYTSGTLLHSFGQFDYAVLEIRQGLVQFSWDLGTGKEVLTVTSISVSDNRWHRIFLQLRDNYAILRVDGRSTQRQKSPGPARSLHTGGIIYIGAKIIGVHGSTLESLIPAQGFVGCMKDLRYGFVVSDSKQTDLHIQEVKHYITPGINRVDLDLDPINIIDDEELDAENPYEKPAGELDQSVMNRHGRMPSLPLHSSDTDKFGSHLIWSRNISFSCERLHHVVEACRSQPCLNGGFCSEDRTGSPNGYRCECPSRFHGLSCEIDLDPCGSSPCLNGGKCVPTAPAGTPGSGISFSPSLVATGDWQDPQFFCHCPEGTFGSRCERGRWCKSLDGSSGVSSSYYGSISSGESEICKHHGECEDGPSGPICWCTGGYTGATCQLDINECERGDACGPGSTCVNFQGGFRCLCPANATGMRCNRLLATPSIVVSDYQELIFVFLVISFIIILIILFIFVRRCFIARERNARNSNAIPLSSSQIKDKDNRIPIGRDNREQHQQLLRNRDSKISNLEAAVRPVSATSDIFADQRTGADGMRSPMDTIKSYGSVGDELEKQQSFINNLMKGTGGNNKEKQQHLGGSAGWDANRDDFSKVQNYMKGEINWAPKGSSKPGSPSGGQPGYGFHWHDSDHLTQPVPNISPVRGGVPAPDIPDSVSVISHDSNNANNNPSTTGGMGGSTDQLPQINLAALPPIDTLVEEDDENERTPLRRRGNNESPPVLPYFESEGTCIDDPINSRLWSVPHPDQYLLTHGIPTAVEGLTAIDEEEDCCTCPALPSQGGNPTNPLAVPIPVPPVTVVDGNKPLAIRNRYSKKKTSPSGGNSAGSSLLTGTASDDEATESSSLLGGGSSGGTPTPQPIIVNSGQPGSRSGTLRQSKTVTIQEPSPSPAPSQGSSGSSGGSLTKKRGNVSKTTHVTQV